MLTVDELAALEQRVHVALERRDLSDLCVVGFGELSVALGARPGPDGSPTVVCKRMPPFRGEGFERYRRLVVSYIEALTARGVDITPTDVVGVTRSDEMTVGYLVQPMLDPSTIGAAVFRSASPETGHLLLQSIGSTVLAAIDDRVSLDAQVSNWSVTAHGVTMLDLGTPLMWDRSGSPLLDMQPFLPMLPLPVRRPMRSVMTALMDRWKEPEGVLLDVAANLMREGLEDWVEPAAAFWSQQLGCAVDIDAARAAYRQDQRLWPQLKRMQRIERRWRAMRGEHYDFFIHSTFGGQSTVW